MLCICNGFQIAVRAGLFGDGLALVENEQATFRDWPCQMHAVEASEPSLWLKGLGGEVLVFPCAHGEGRFVYGSTDGWRPALRYPNETNPDGSSAGIAGITSLDGMILGMMNHPERNIRSETNLAIFENGVAAAAS